MAGPFITGSYADRRKLPSDSGRSCTLVKSRGLPSAKSGSSAPRSHRRKAVLSPVALTLALTREQRGREAPLLRVGVERVVRRHLLPPAINNAKEMARQNDHLLGFRCIIY